ncbi:MAG: sigma-54 dependent transcriptional regulator [Acidobacteria bacterium]|jgi:NtrC-family two-component system response regulator AlgB|nr:sigma-54 dependent transcriptional regulator [Acidobacteriota bacterium]
MNEVEKATDRDNLNILVIDDELNIRKTISMCLELEGHSVRTVNNFDDAISEIKQHLFDVVFLDLRLGTKNGLELIPYLQVHSPLAKIVVITAYASIDSAVEAIRKGAADYIPKPFTPAQIKIVVEKIFEIRTLQKQIDLLKANLDSNLPEIDFSSKNPSVQKLMSVAREVAAADVNILLKGESGTGKTVLARAIHDWSQRAKKPFVVVSCPSLSADLLENELFGHAKGSFTGAVTDYPGRISQCREGTLFLDEIGDLPLSIQPKLLRFIQEKKYERVGENITRNADVRLIAATNINLEKAVKEGRFREDLYYRLNVVEIEIPPLRERKEDIENLASRMLVFFGRHNHRNFTGFTGEAMSLLKNYSWPGNVRELRNMIERMTIFCKSEIVGKEFLPEKILGSEELPSLGDSISLVKIEEIHIRRVLASADSLQKAAEILDIDQATLWRKRKTYGI